MTFANLKRMGFDDTSAPEILPNWLTYESAVERAQSNLERAFEGLPLRRSTSLMQLQFEHAFEPILDAVMAGQSLHKAVREYPIALDMGRFNSWIQRNPERKQRYVEALEVQAGVLIDEVIELADGLNSDGSVSMADVTRNKLQIDARFRVAAAHNRKVYGESKQIDLTHTSINLTAILAERDKTRQEFLGSIDGEYKEITDGRTGVSVDQGG